MISQFFNIKRLNMLEIMLETFNKGVIVCDREGRVVLYNKAYSLIDNLEQEKVLGQLIEKNYLMKKNESTLRNVMKTKNPHLTHRQQYTTISGKTVDALKDTFPIVDEGDVIGAFSIVHDVYNAKKETADILKELLDNEEKISNIFNFSKVKFKSKKMILNMKILDEAISAKKNISLFSNDGCESKEIAFLASKKVQMTKTPIYFNCASIQEKDQQFIFFGDTNQKGILEKSINNTIILENLDFLSIQNQINIKDFMDQNSIHVISIFNKYQNEIIAEKKMSLDFFYSLNEVSLRIPNLNERKEDISVFIELYSKNMTKNITISPGAYKYLIAYDWIGNYLELMNVLRNATLLVENNIITEANLPDYIVNFDKTTSSEESSEFTSLVDILEYTEKEIIIKTLEKNEHNVSKSAKILGISRQNLQHRIKRLSI